MKLFLYLCITLSLHSWVQAQEMTRQALMTSMKDTARVMKQNIQIKAAPSQADWERSIKYVQQGIKAYNLGDFETATRHHRRAVRINPHHAVAYLELGRSLEQRKQFQGALKAAIQAQVLLPDFERAASLIARVLDRMGFRDLALTEHRKLLEKFPDNMQANLYLGLQKWESGESEKGQKMVIQGLEVASERISLYLLCTLRLWLPISDPEDREIMKKSKVSFEESISPRSLHEKRLVDDTLGLSREAGGHPYPLMLAAENRFRKAWRERGFKKAFPGVETYSPSVEEELGLYTSLLGEWKNHKIKDPHARHALYDTLIKAERLQHFEGFVLALIHRQFPRGFVDGYLKSNPEKNQRYMNFGRDCGFLPYWSNRGINWVKMIMPNLRDSMIPYELKEYKPNDAEVFSLEEGIRFRKGYLAEGSHAFGEGDVQAALETRESPEKLFHSLAFLLESDEEYPSIVTQLAKNHQLRLKPSPLPKAFPGALTDNGLSIHIDRTHLYWFLYWAMKALMRNESSFNYGLHREELDQGPSYEEESQAFFAAIQGYKSARGRSGFETDPFFEKLLRVEKERLWNGFILFEVIHRYYGIRLTHLEKYQQRFVLEYIRRFAVEPIPH